MTNQARNDARPSPADLTLYHTESCWYCAHVRQVIHQLGIEIPLRDVSRSPQWRAELIEGGGKGQVPCLRIEHADRRVEWMYESADIVRHLRTHFAPGP